MAPKNNKNDVKSPSAEEVIALAESVGYAQRRPEVSSTLFFITEGDDENSKSAVKINVYHTTRSVMTHLHHPSEAGLNQMWRSHAYDTLDELREILKDPRKHTGKGYRNAHKAVRGCVECGEMKKRNDFSKNQWAKGPDGNRCRACTGAAGNGSSIGSLSLVDDVTQDLQVISLNDNQDEEEEDDDDDDGGDFPRLTMDNLAAHDKTTHKKKKGARQDMERRQFSCPECPKQGRGNYVFYKKVPKFKPVVKCGRCKKASRGNCKRLYPVAKEDERGYGLFHCPKCNDKWGSSRAVNGIGQSCYTCASKGLESVVPPFRMEVFRRRKGAKKMQRVPKQPIQEDAEQEYQYDDADRQRNEDSGANALAFGSGGGGPRSARNARDDFESNDSASSGYGSRQSYVQVERPDADSDDNGPVDSMRIGIPKGYKHMCVGCSRGLCKTRKIPKSQVHDTSDGNTVSTRSSIVSNSSVDKTEFVDRDEDFEGFDTGSDDRS